MSLTIFRIGMLLVLLNTSAVGQIPRFEISVLDVNTAPRLMTHFDVPAYYPLADSGFFFSFYSYDPNPLLYFTGSRLDTVVRDGTINGRVYDRYAGGYLLYRNDGTYESSRTYHLDSVTYDTVPLVNDLLEVLHVFADGRRLLSGGEGLYGIGDTPQSLVFLESALGYLTLNYTALGDRFVYEGARGVYATDGTPAGTVKLTDAYPVNYGDFRLVGDKVYFTSYDSLYVSDGTPAGTAAVTFDHLPEEQRPTSFRVPTTTSNGPVLQGSAPGLGEYLYYLDTAAGGFVPLVASGSTPLWGNDSIQLFRQRPDLGNDVIVTDGTPAGTGSLLSIDYEEVQNADWEVYGIAALGNGALFFGTNFSDTPRMWAIYPGREPKSYTLPAGTATSYTDYHPTRTELYLMARQGGAPGVYRFDSAVVAFERLTRLEPDYGRMELSDGGILVQVHEDAYAGQQSTLIHYGGRTTLVDGYLGSTVQGRRPTWGSLSLKQIGDILYGISTDAAVGEAIIAFDLISGEQRVLHDLYPFTLSSEPFDLQAGDRAGYFHNGGDFYGSGQEDRFERLLEEEDITVTPLPGLGYSLLHTRGGRAWYLSDGTQRGTRRLADPGFRIESTVVTLNGDAYFIGSSAGSEYGYRLSLVKVDGGSATFTEVFGTQVMASAVPYSGEFSLASTGTRIYFPFTTTGARYDIWSSDGSPAGTRAESEFSRDFGNRQPHNLTSGDGIISYTLRVPNDYFRDPRYQFYRESSGEVFTYTLPENAYTDLPMTPVAVAGRIIVPTVDGLEVLPASASVPSVLVPCASCYAAHLTVINDTTVLYSAVTPERARALYRLNPLTGRHVVLIPRLFEGRVLEGPLAVLNDLVVVATDLGDDYYRYGGLEMVHVPSAAVADSLVVSYFSTPREITVAGNRFFFISEDDTYGDEVFVVTFPDLPVLPSGTVSTRNREVPGFQLAVWPNPSRETVNLRTEFNDYHTYRLVDLRGTTVLQGSYAGIAHSFPVAQLHTGVYVLEVIRRTTGARAISKIAVQTTD